MKRKIDEAARTITFTFGEDVAPITFHADAAHDDNRAYAMLHGFNQRLGDTAASKKTEAERREAIAELIAHYESGTPDWNTRTSDRKPAQNPTILAIAAKLGVSYTEAEAEVARRMLAEIGA